MLHNGLTLHLIHLWQFIGVDLIVLHKFHIGAVQTFGGLDGLLHGQISICFLQMVQLILIKIFN
jgi:hypothetical protein